MQRWNLFICLKSWQQPWEVFLDLHLIHERIRIPLPGLKGSHRSVVDSTQIFGFGESFCWVWKRTIRTEGWQGSRHQRLPRSHLPPWLQRWRKTHACPGWVSTKAEMDLIGEMDRLEKKCFPFPWTWLSSVFSSSRMFLFPPAITGHSHSQPASFLKCNLGESLWPLSATWVVAWLALTWLSLDS